MQSHCCTVVTCEYEARIAASEEEQRLLQEVEQWKKMFHAREMEISWLQRESEQLRVQDKYKYTTNNINYIWSSYLNYNNDQMLLRILLTQ